MHDDLISNYKRCQDITRDFYQLCGDQAYIDPIIMNKQGASTNFSFIAGTLQSSMWYGWQQVSDLDFNFTSEEGVDVDVIRTGDIVLDCGANTGFTTVYFAKIVGDDGLVFAFDPFPQNTDAIEYNILLNELKNVQVIQKAIGSKRRALFLSQATQNVTQYMTKNVIKTFEVTIDDFARFKPTFLKIDVEGYEVEAL